MPAMSDMTNSCRIDHLPNKGRNTAFEQVAVVRANRELRVQGPDEDPEGRDGGYNSNQGRI
ncbi:MAG TPA: hypothetical protein VMW38_08080 [Terriglobia bacterium]|nr:hypothetical protein [Terriglobia bacterium]